MNKIRGLILTLFLIAGTGCAFSSQILKDEFMENALSKRQIEKPKICNEYDYLNTDVVEIPLNITKKVSTGGKNKVYEGQKLTFIVEKNVFYKKNLLVPKGAVATGIVKNTVTRGFTGIPGEIYIGNFEIKNIDPSKLSEISKKGFNAAVLILPLKLALTVLPPFGTITNVAIGGNAVFRPDRTVTLYYYPKSGAKCSI